ncbi:MAG: hypothetical protein WBV46_20630 [Terriglobales bacterium]|jgi:hypothetical protein
MPMNETQNNRIRELCSLIQVEQDQQKFVKLLQELNRLLTEKGSNSGNDFHPDNRNGHKSIGGERGRP